MANEDLGLSFATVMRFGIYMSLTKERLWKVAANPELGLYLLNAQFRMAFRAKVPISTRLRGRIRIAGGGTVAFGKGVMLIGSIVPIEIISLPDARVAIGDHSLVNYGTSISAHKEIIIGNRCKIGHYVFMIDNNGHDFVEREKPSVSSPIVLEDNVWIGAHSIILPGVRIGRNSIVGAGSVVTRDVPANALVAGNPAALKRTLTSA